MATVRKFAIWKDKVSGEILNGKICPNIALKSVYRPVCPSASSQRFFFDAEFCPDCGTKLSELIIAPQKTMIESTEAYGAQTRGKDSDAEINIVSDLDVFNARFDGFTDVTDPPTNWEATVYQNSRAYLVNEGGRGYSAVLQLNTDMDPLLATQYLSNTFLVEPGETYTISMSIMERATVPYLDSVLAVAIVPDTYSIGDATPTVITTLVDGRTPSTTEWENVSGTFTVPEDMTAGKLLIMLLADRDTSNLRNTPGVHGTSYGALLIDDVSVYGKRSSTGTLNGKFDWWPGPVGDPYAYPGHWYGPEDVFIERSDDAYGDNAYAFKCSINSGDYVYTSSGADVLYDFYTVKAYIKPSYDTTDIQLSVAHHYDDGDIVEVLDTVLHTDPEFSTSEYLLLTGTYQKRTNHNTTIRIRLDDEESTPEMKVGQVSVERVAPKVSFHIARDFQHLSNQWKYKWIYREFEIGRDPINLGVVGPHDKERMHFEITIFNGENDTIALSQSSLDSPDGFQYYSDTAERWVQMAEEGILNTDLPYNIRYIPSVPLAMGTYYYTWRRVDYTSIEDKTEYPWEEYSDLTVAGLDAPDTDWPIGDDGLLRRMPFDMTVDGWYYLNVTGSNPKCVYDRMQWCHNPVERGSHTGYGIDENASDKPAFAMAPENSATDEEVAMSAVFHGGTWQIDENGDGIPESYTNRGFCYNSYCPGYVGSNIATEYFAIEYNADSLNSITADRALYQRMADILVCVNNQIDADTGEYVCDNFKNSRAIFPEKRICSRKDTVVTGTNRAKYMCNLYDGSGADPFYRTHGSEIYTSSVDDDGVITEPTELQIRTPAIYKWAYDDDVAAQRKEHGIQAIDACPGLLLDMAGNVTDIRCDAPLVGASYPRLCPSCGQPTLVPFYNQTNQMLVKVCPNTAKQLVYTALCSTASDGTIFDYEDTECPECGTELIYSAPPFIIDNEPVAQTFTLTDDQRNKLRDGKTYTWSHCAWDTETQLPAAVGHGIAGEPAHGWADPESLASPPGWFVWYNATARQQAFWAAQKVAFQNIDASLTDDITAAEDMIEAAYKRMFYSLRNEGHYYLAGLSYDGSQETIDVTKPLAAISNYSSGDILTYAKWWGEYNFQMNYPYIDNTPMVLVGPPSLTETADTLYSWVQHPLVCRGNAHKEDESPAVESAIWDFDFALGNVGGPSDPGIKCSICLTSEEHYFNNIQGAWTGHCYADGLTKWKRIELYIEEATFKLRLVTDGSSSTSPQSAATETVINNNLGSALSSTLYRCIIKRMSDGVISIAVYNGVSEIFTSTEITKVFVEPRRFMYLEFRSYADGAIVGAQNIKWTFPVFSTLCDVDWCKDYMLSMQNTDKMPNRYILEMSHKQDFADMDGVDRKLRVWDSDEWTCAGDIPLQAEVQDNQLAVALCPLKGSRISSEDAYNYGYSCPICSGHLERLSIMASDRVYTENNDYETSWGQQFGLTFEMTQSQYPGQAHDIMYMDLDQDGFPDWTTAPHNVIQNPFFDCMYNDIANISNWTIVSDAYTYNPNTGAKTRPLDPAKDAVWKYVRIAQNLKWMNNPLDIKRALEFHIYMPPTTPDTRYGVNTVVTRLDLKQEFEIAVDLTTDDQKLAFNDTVIGYYLPTETCYPGTIYQLGYNNLGYQMFALQIIGYNSSAPNEELCTVLYDLYGSNTFRDLRNVTDGSNFRGYTHDIPYQLNDSNKQGYLYKSVGHPADLDQWIFRSFPVWTDFERARAYASKSGDITHLRINLMAFVYRDMNINRLPAEYRINVPSHIRFYVSELRNGWRSQYDNNQRAFTDSDFNGRYWWRARPSNWWQSLEYSYVTQNRYLSPLSNQYYQFKEFPYYMNPSYQKKYYKAMGPWLPAHSFLYNDMRVGLIEDDSGNYIHNRDNVGY